MVMKILTTFIASVLLIQITVCAQDQQRPNVLFIICDDLNDSLEGMGGHPQAKTPNLSRLAAEGVRFTNGYVAPIPFVPPVRQV